MWEIKYKIRQYFLLWTILTEYLLSIFFIITPCLFPSLLNDNIQMIVDKTTNSLVGALKRY